MEFRIAVRHDHISRLADAGKAIVFFHQRRDLLACSGSKKVAEPIAQIALAILCQRVFVPCQIHHHRQLQRCCQRIGYVGYPGAILVVVDCRAVRFVTMTALGLQVIPVVQHFEQQSRSRLSHLHLAVVANHLHVLDGLSALLLVLLARQFRHLVVVGQTDVKAVYDGFIVGSIVLSVYLPEGVAFQSQHQSCDAAIVLRVHPLASVERQSSEFYSRNLQPFLLGRGRDGAVWLRLKVVPRHEGSDASQLRQLHDGVGGASGVASYHDEAVLPHSDVEGILDCNKLMKGNLELFNSRKLLVRK